MVGKEINLPEDYIGVIVQKDQTSKFTAREVFSQAT